MLEKISGNFGNFSLLGKNILGFVRCWSSFPSIRPVIPPSKFLIREEEDDGTGGGR
jgi:hypothetical protein